ncbi:hypothetical protein [Kibdelosporangium philippinense]|uniref:hypothetical protein n=1 Tax=Kibdelosporangium philippinense TaxID=211113 RepID=UPI00361C587F
MRNASDPARKHGVPAPPMDGTCPPWPSCRPATIRERNLWRVGRREGDLHGTNPGNRRDTRGK